MRIAVGTPIKVAGWSGRVVAIRSGIVVAIKDGWQPNDHLRGYRTFPLRQFQASEKPKGAALRARADEIARSWDKIHGRA
jgi:hypothetical protein